MDNQFDLYDLPEGHQDRFEGKLAQRLARRPRRKLLPWVAAAAGLAAVVWLGLRSDARYAFERARTPTTSSSSASFMARTPEAVYAAYLEEVGKLYELLADNTGADNGTVDWEAVLHELTEENMPLFDQLPEELSASEKTALLKQYYGGLLNEAGQIRKQLNKENRFLR